MADVRELGAGETARAARALLELRPDRGPAAALAARVDEVQRPQGYRLADAHRFYFDHGLRIVSFHFARLEEPPPVRPARAPAPRRRPAGA